MRRVLAAAGLLAVIVVLVVVATGAGSGSGDPTYKIEFDNAFGLINGSQLKVAGVRAGTITAVDLDPKSLHAIVTVQVTQRGFGFFRSDASCETRPQALIGEYFIDCQPGQYGSPLPSGATIPVAQTRITIPADLITDVMRMPYRQRLTLIINELGAAVAGRSGDLQAALQRAVPALTQTDNLLNLLANDSTTLKQLTGSADSVLTALADNSAQVQRFIDEANRTVGAAATQQANLASTLHQLPGFLEQLRPAMVKLGRVAGANLPAVQNLNAAAPGLQRLFTDLPGFANAALPAVQALGKASVTGKSAAQAAAPTVKDLNTFAKPAPELAQNLAIVLHDLDNRNRAVEPNSLSPGGKGFTGLEALLKWVFHSSLVLNVYGPLGHVYATDLFVDPLCSPYASAQTVADNLAKYGSQYRRCYSWLGPNQPGINEPDPSNPGACVPDPGGAPPGETGPRTSACRLTGDPSAVAARATAATASGVAAAAAHGATGSAGGGGRATRSGGAGLPQLLGHVLSVLGNATSVQAPAAASAPATSSATTTGDQAAPAASGAQAQQLLNYLLAP